MVDGMLFENDPDYRDQHPTPLEPVQVAINGGQSTTTGQAITVHLQPGANQIDVQTTCGDVTSSMRFTVNRVPLVETPANGADIELPPATADADSTLPTIDNQSPAPVVEAEGVSPMTAAPENAPPVLIFRVTVDGKRVDVPASIKMTAAELFTVIGSMCEKNPNTLTGSMIGHGTRRINIDMSTPGLLSVC